MMPDYICFNEFSNLCCSFQATGIFTASIGLIETVNTPDEAHQERPVVLSEKDFHFHNVGGTFCSFGAC